MESWKKCLYCIATETAGYLCRLLWYFVSVGQDIPAMHDVANGIQRLLITSPFGQYRECFGRRFGLAKRTSARVVVNERTNKKVIAY